MKKTSLLLILLSAILFLSSAFSFKAQAETVNMRPYLVFSTTVYKSTNKSTLEQELKSVVKEDKISISAKEINQFVKDWKKVDFAYSDSGFKTSSYYNEKTNELIVAFAGSDNLEDWLTDARHYSYLPNYQLKEVKYYVQYKMKNKKGVPKSKHKTLKVSFTGHSLGGLLSQVGGATILDDANYKKHMKLIVTFNSLGLSEPNLVKKNFKYFNPENYLTQSSWVNNKNHKYDNYFIHYTIQGEIAQQTNFNKKMIKLGKHQITFPAKSNTLKDHSIKQFFVYNLVR